MTAQSPASRRRKALATALLIIGALLASPFLLAMMLSSKDRR